MTDASLFPVTRDWAKRAHMDADAYAKALKRVKADPDKFWREVAQRLTWIKSPKQIKDVSFHKQDFRIRWFADGVLNVSANCVDRWLSSKGKDTAIIWEGDDPAASRRIT